MQLQPWSVVWSTDGTRPHLIIRGVLVQLLHDTLLCLTPEEDGSYLFDRVGSHASLIGPSSHGRSSRGKIRSLLPATAIVQVP